MKIGQETLNFNIDTGDDSQVITEEAFKQLTPKKHLSSEKASLSTLPPQQVDLNAWVSFMHEFMGDPGSREICSQNNHSRVSNLLTMRVLLV